jgi:hypothetical protein
VHSNALVAFERNCGHTQRHMVERRSNQPTSHTVALAGPRSPSLPAMRRGGYLRSNVECTIECKNINAFKRMACIRPVSTLSSINRTLVLNFYVVTFLSTHSL